MISGGVSCNVEELAKGLFDLMLENDKARVLELGLLPNDVMQVVITGMRNRIISIAAKQHGISEEAATRCVDEEKLREISAPFIAAISVRILELTEACNRKGGNDGRP